ncbi:hypothetical protein C2845_PM13G07040 [Panicum miliaceum]|uniref:Uncharacterized protein n=1 Tax=Panicum miliaceum TaxID=4540 RepID=A0A3L6RLS9_PANMI|nr:hypothetical protein C2845_PM13G07040 [Panicum miliaceum]
MEGNDADEPLSTTASVLKELLGSQGPGMRWSAPAMPPCRRGSRPCHSPRSSSGSAASWPRPRAASP